MALTLRVKSMTKQSKLLQSANIERFFFWARVRRGWAALWKHAPLSIPVTLFLSANLQKTIDDDLCAFPCGFSASTTATAISAACEMLLISHDSELLFQSNNRKKCFQVPFALKNKQRMESGAEPSWEPSWKVGHSPFPIRQITTSRYVRVYHSNLWESKPKWTLRTARIHGNYSLTRLPRATFLIQHQSLSDFSTIRVVPLWTVGSQLSVITSGMVKMEWRDCAADTERGV